MFYKFNNVVGRILPSTQAEAYSSQGLSPLARPASVITFDSKKTQPIHEPATKITTGPTKITTRPTSSVPQPQEPAQKGLGLIPATPRYQRVMQMQSIFLKDDGKMVWQKLGLRDRLPFYISMGLLVVGFAVTVTQLVQMASPKKDEE